MKSLSVFCYDRLMNTFAYIDESGDTGYTKKSSRYFIITVVLVNNIYLLRRIAKNIYAYKINKRKTSSLHACKENLIIRKKYIKNLSQADVNCVVYCVDKYQVKVEDVYLYALIKLGEYFVEKNIHFTIAQKDTRKSYNKKIAELFHQYGLQIEFSNPNKEKSLQIADFYSWAVYSHLEYDNSIYFLELRHQIVLLS